MLSLLAKAVSSYLWKDYTTWDDYESFKNNLHITENKEYSGHKKDEEDALSDNPDPSHLKIEVQGHITSINTAQGYGLINNNIFFNLDSVIGKSVTIGQAVTASAFRNREEDGWRASSVFPLSELWDDHSGENLPSDKGAEMPHRSAELKNIVQSSESTGADNFTEKTLIGMITTIREDSLILNNLHTLITEGSQIIFPPVEGDWVIASYVEDDMLIAKYIKPLREDYIEGKISSLRTETGVIDWKVVFDVGVCKKGYQPKRWDEVSAKIIESRQGQFHWRAVNVNPKGRANRTLLGVSPSQMKFIQDILQDKEGISISSNLDFGKVSVGSRKYITAWIRNGGKETQLLTKCKLQTSGSEESQFTLGDVRLHSWSGEEQLASEETVSIHPGGSAYLNIVCEPRSLGRQRQLILFKFENFVIGRYIMMNVHDPAQDLIGPVAPFQQVNRTQQIENICAGKNGAIIPGQKPWLPTRSFSIRLPQFTIPKHLWELESSKKDLKLHFSVLNEELTYHNYVSRFTTLLHLEEMQMHISMRQMDMVETCLRHHGPFLALVVPGLSEGRPSLLVGDKVILSPPVEVGDGPRYEGFVHEVLQNEVLLKFHENFHGQYGGEIYDVEFHFNRTPLRRCHYAIGLAPRLSEEVLFPSKLCVKPPMIQFITEDDNCEKEDCGALDLNLETSSTNTGTTGPQVLSMNKSLQMKQSASKHFIPQTLLLKWINRSLNERQKAAVTRILSGMCRPLPYIIFGPPGTGKTVTTVEAILQVFLHVSSSRILTCTPSNSAADLICQRIHESGVVQEKDMVRLNAFQRIDQTIPDAVKPYCKDGDELQIVAYHRIIVCTCQTAGTFYSLGLSTGHFTHVFIDEAGQATEPECMISACFSGMAEGQLILAGDPMQLGPILQSVNAKKYGLEISFLERLMQQPLYQRNEKKFSKYGDYDPFLVTKLVNNYRSHPIILEPSSKIFYHDDLKFCAPKSVTEKFCKWPSLPKEGFPLLFHGIRGEDLQEGNSPSWFNPAEAVQIIQYLQDLYNRDVSPGDIGIITPYKKQVEKIRLLMGSFGLTQCKVGSVEEFQGQERPVIILSTVRSSQEMVKFDVRHNLGFLSNPKRFNVAITRAQSLLIIVGDPWLLQKDPFWESLIQYCVISGSYTGCDLEQGVELEAEE